MKLNFEADFSTYDLIMVHNWLAQRGWQKTGDHPFWYQKETDQGWTTGNNLFHAISIEFKEDLQKDTANDDQ